MEPTEILVERIDGNVRHLVERFDEHVEASARLSARVSHLEKLKDRGLAWLAGAGAMIGLLIWALGLGGCVAPVQSSILRMEHRPARLLVDDALPECEVTAVLEAAKFWEYQGVFLLFQAYEPEIPVRLGDIYILDSDIGNPGIVGLTTSYVRVLTPGHPEIVLATIALDSCSPLVAAHEIGHALGLRHREEEGALMHPNQTGAGWALSEWEKALVGF